MSCNQPGCKPKLALLGKPLDVVVVVKKVSAVSADAAYTLTITYTDGNVVEFNLPREVVDKKPHVDKYVVGFDLTDEDKKLTLTMADSSKYSIPVCTLAGALSECSEFSMPDYSLTGATLSVNRDTPHAMLGLHQGEHKQFIDVTDLMKHEVASGAVEGDFIVLKTRADEQIKIDVSGLKSKMPEPTPPVAPTPALPRIESGTFTNRGNGYWLDLKRSDNTLVSVDFTNTVGVIEDKIYNRITKTGYRIVTANKDYTLTAADFDGRTVVRGTKVTGQTVTITKPPKEDFVGLTVIIRKVGGNGKNYLTITAGEGVTLTPTDVSPLRRDGSSATLVYIGNGVYDVYGELP